MDTSNVNRNEYNEGNWAELCKPKMKYEDVIRNKIEYKLKRAKLNFYDCGEKKGKLLASRLNI